MSELHRPSLWIWCCITSVPAYSYQGTELSPLVTFAAFNWFAAETAQRSISLFAGYTIRPQYFLLTPANIFYDSIRNFSNAAQLSSDSRIQIPKSHDWVTARATWLFGSHGVRAPDLLITSFAVRICCESSLTALYVGVTMQFWCSSQVPARLFWQEMYGKNTIHLWWQVLAWCPKHVVVIRSSTFFTIGSAFQPGVQCMSLTLYRVLCIIWTSV